MARSEARATRDGCWCSIVDRPSSWRRRSPRCSTRRRSSRRTACARCRSATQRRTTCPASRTRRIDYEPAESRTAMYGGNSNWRGPVWLPINYLVIRALLQYDRFFGDRASRSSTRPARARSCTLRSDRRRPRRPPRRHLAARRRRPTGRCTAAYDVLDDDPAWKDNLLFFEYFHGDTGAGLGAIAPDRLDRAGRRPDPRPAGRSPGHVAHEPGARTLRDRRDHAWTTRPASRWRSPAGSPLWPTAGAPSGRAARDDGWRRSTAPTSTVPSRPSTSRSAMKSPPAPRLAVAQCDYGELNGAPRDQVDADRVRAPLDAVPAAAGSRPSTASATSSPTSFPLDGARCWSLVTSPPASVSTTSCWMWPSLGTSPQSSRGGRWEHVVEAASVAGMSTWITPSEPSHNGPTTAASQEHFRTCVRKCSSSRVRRRDTAAIAVDRGATDRS